MNSSIESVFEVYNSVIKSILFSAFFFFLIATIASIFKKNLIDSEFLKIVAYFLIFVSFLNGILFILNYDNYSQRLGGPYKVTGWTMILFHLFSTLILLIPKIQKKAVSYLIVLFLMQNGRFFEILVILVTTLHRDYL